jgi:hypothetical protein
VGFNGVKEEDLNRVPVLVRPRVTLGLPHRLSLELGWVPPLRIDGIEPGLLSLAVERELYGGPRWAVAGRIFGQIGEVKGDLTCSEADASFPPGSADNLFGCLAPSRERSSFDHVGAHLGAGYRLRRDGGPTLLFGGAFTRHSLDFQVDALTYDIHDRTRLTADGTTWALDAGISIPAASRMEVDVVALWSPLEVVRPPRASPENDDLLHVKALVRYRVR